MTDSHLCPLQCDSKLPSCSACAAANVECNQEDRHRQTLKPRGHTDMVEGQLSKCIQVLQKFIPDFKVEDVDMIMAQHGIVFIKPEETSLPPPPPLIRADSAAPVHSNAYESPSDGSSTTLNGYDRAQSVSYSDPRPSPQSGIAPPTVDVKGQDPQSNDLSSTGGLIKAFGVAKSIVRDLPKPGEFSSLLSFPSPFWHHTAMLPKKKEQGPSRVIATLVFLSFISHLKFVTPCL